MVNGRVDVQFGTSPFHVKGLVYRGALNYCERKVPGGLRAMNEVAATENEALARFMKQNFLASAWYDLLPLPMIDALAARLCNEPRTQFVRTAARTQAREELGGIYRMFLKLLSPTTVSQYLPRIAAQYYDFGTVETRQESASAVVVIRTGMPMDIADWLQAVALEYLEVALELSGAKSVHVRILPREAGGEYKGFPICSLRARIQWD
jgi:hypothetical protein